MDLVDSTVDALVLGRELDAGAWRPLLDLMTRPVPEVDAKMARSLVTLARMVTAEEARDLDAMAKSIPPEHRILVMLAEAVASSRALDTTSATSLSRYVHGAFALVPYLSEAKLAKPALQRLAGLQDRAVELGGETLDFSVTCLFALLANRLAKDHEDPGYLEQAAALAGRLRASPAVLGRYIVTSNLVTTFKELARYRPAEAERYLLGGLALATELYQARHDIARMYPDPNGTREMPVHWLNSLMFLRTELARVNPARAAEHIAAAWQAVACLRQFADELADPDLRREATKMEHFVRDRVGVAPGPPASQPDGELSSGEAVANKLTEAVLTAQEAARDTLALPAGAPRHAAVAQHLERLYGDLARAFHPVIQELGVNHHVSRVLLSLGAVASGRLWPLSFPAVRASVMHLPDLASRSMPFYRDEQELPSRSIFELSLNYPSLVCAVAAFSDALSEEADLAGVLRKVLREQNRKLMERLLPAVQPQHVDGRRMATLNDVVRIASLIRSFGGHLEPRPPPERRGRDLEPDPIDDPPRVLPPEEPSAQDEPWNFEQWLAPERLIGQVLTFRFDTGKKSVRFDSILGQGRESVVFAGTDLDTGEEHAYSMDRADFGPRTVLTRHVELVSNGREAYNPQSLLTICEAGLAEHPGDVTFAFNKGAALADQGDLPGASDALDVALATNPEHLWCLVQKARILSLLGQHSGAVMHLARASRLHPDALRNLLGDMAGFRDPLAASVGAVLQADPRRLDAGDLMRDYFSARLSTPADT